jgi:DNA modification methylase
MDLLVKNHIVMHGSGANMNLLSNEQADLVLTSPPYFDNETETLLRVRRSEQNDIDKVVRNLYSYASTLRPIFREIHRILKNGRPFILQSKDIRYGDITIPLSDHHLCIAMSCGFNLITRFNWVPIQASFRRRPSVAMNKKVGQFRVETGETFMILVKNDHLETRGDIDDLSTDFAKIISPLWRMPFRRRTDDHPHVSPRPVLRNLIKLMSHEGDLVVDPFAGYGTVIQVAKSLGRNAIGWDINKDCVFEANKRLA